MKTSVTLALLASLLVSGVAYAHGSHFSPTLPNGGNSTSPNDHHIRVDDGNVSDPVKILDRRHDDRWFDKDHERFDRLRMLERELAHLIRHDRSERDQRLVEEIKRLRFEIYRIENGATTAAALS